MTRRPDPRQTERGDVLDLAVGCLSLLLTVAGAAVVVWWVITAVWQQVTP